MGSYTVSPGETGLPNSTVLPASWLAMLSRDIMVSHIKGLLAKLGLYPSFYSRHSLHTGGATTATMVRSQGLGPVSGPLGAGRATHTRHIAGRQWI